MSQVICYCGGCALLIPCNCGQADKLAGRQSNQKLNTLPSVSVSFINTGLDVRLFHNGGFRYGFYWQHLGRKPFILGRTLL